MSEKKEVDGSRDEEIQGLVVRTDCDRATWLGLPDTERGRCRTCTNNWCKPDECFGVAALRQIGISYAQLQAP